MSESLYSPQKQTPEDQVVLHPKHHEAPNTKGQNFRRRGLPILGGTAALMAFGIPAVFNAVDTINEQNTCIAGPESVTVNSGDSLYSIAKEIAPGVDLGVTAGRLADVNDIAGDIIHPGQTISVPVCGPDINQ